MTPYHQRLFLTTTKVHSPIRIKRERDVAHLPVRQPLLERHAHALEPRARLLDVRYRHRDVSEPATGVGVARRIVKFGVGLRAVVVRELEDALARAARRFLVLFGCCSAAVVEREEVQREVAVAILCSDKGRA